MNRYFEVVRFGFGKESTLGRINRIEGEQQSHRCFSIEDERRVTKVHGKTCIPCGIYEIVLRTFGGKHEEYRARFGDKHHGMLWLKNVTGFTDVLIHILNFDYQTDGCIGPGVHPKIRDDGEFWVASSEAAYLKLYAEMSGFLIAGDAVFLEVREAAPWP